MAAISLENWAKIMAKAYLEEDFKNLLQKDPLRAAERAKQEIPNFPNFDILYNFAEFDFGQGMDNVQDLRLYHPAQLDDIVNQTRNRSMTVSELHPTHSSSPTPSTLKKS